jgi:hypothetical protein
MGKAIGDIHYIPCADEVGRGGNFRHMSLLIHIWTMGTRVDHEQL